MARDLTTERAAQVNKQKNQPAATGDVNAAGLTERLPEMNTRTLHLGDIGEGQREVEYEPLTAPSVPEPVRTPEKVPA